MLFNVPSDPSYGMLSHRSLEDMLDGARVEVAPYKRDPKDFVLWKPSTPELPGWDSPWGRGRPGWHIECSAMIRKHLGHTIDIHGGGSDLTFPHHENELAQGRCVDDGETYVRYWLHNGMLTLGDEKMSKSVGNIITLRDLLARHGGEVLRYALLSGNYRSPLAWSDDLLKQAQASLDRMYQALLDVPPGNATQPGTVPPRAGRSVSGGRHRSARRRSEHHRSARRDARHRQRHASRQRPDSSARAARSADRRRLVARPADGNTGSSLQVGQQLSMRHTSKSVSPRGTPRAHRETSNSPTRSATNCSRKASNWKTRATARGGVRGRNPYLPAHSS